MIKKAFFSIFFTSFLLMHPLYATMEPSKGSIHQRRFPEIAVKLWAMGAAAGAAAVALLKFNPQMNLVFSDMWWYFEHFYKSAKGKTIGADQERLNEESNRIAEDRRFMVNPTAEVGNKLLLDILSYIGREFNGLKKLWGGDAEDKQLAIDIIARFLIFMTRQHAEIDPCQIDIAMSFRTFFGRFAFAKAADGQFDKDKVLPRIFEAISFISQGLVQFSKEEEDYHRIMLTYWLTSQCVK